LKPCPRSPKVTEVVSGAISFIASQQLLTWRFVPNIEPLQTGLICALWLASSLRKVRSDRKPGADTELLDEDDWSPLLEVGDIVDRSGNDMADGSTKPEAKAASHPTRKTLGWI